MPMAPPTAAPMTVLFPGLPGPVTLDVFANPAVEPVAKSPAQDLQ
jgi:hypothetical protein